MYIKLIGIIFVLLIILLVIISIMNFLDILKIKKRYKILGVNDENVGIVVEKYIRLFEELKDKNISIEKRVDRIENNILSNIQKVGVRRYNAFNDMSSNLSFSVALLDANNTGIIITELYLRNSSTVYVREIKNGNCEIRLSEEEIEAIEDAQRIYDKRIRGDAVKC